MIFEKYFEQLSKEENRIKGISFEYFCASVLKERFKNVFVYRDFDWKKYDFPETDCGVDIVASNGGKWTLVQCKFVSDSKRGICQSMISTLFSFKESVKDKVTEKTIVMTTATKRSKFFDKCKDIEFYLRDDFNGKTVPSDALKWLGPGQDKDKDKTEDKCKDKDLVKLVDNTVKKNIKECIIQ